MSLGLLNVSIYLLLWVVGCLHFTQEVVGSISKPVSLNTEAPERPRGPTELGGKMLWHASVIPQHCRCHHGHFLRVVLSIFVFVFVFVL